MTLKPFLSSRKKHEAAALRPAHQPAADDRAAPGGANGAGPGPVVETIREGGKVARIVVTCTCGERIEIECLYPAGS